MRSMSEGNVKVNGGFRETNFFPSISRSFFGAQAVVHTISTKANIGRRSFLVFTLLNSSLTFPPLSVRKRGKRKRRLD